MNTQVTTLNVHAALAYVTNTFLNLRDLQTHGSELQHEAADPLLPLVYGTLANIKASSCIVSRRPVTQDIINVYQLSLECDLISGKLKYASMLYCSGQYEKAAEMLNHCESLLGPDVEHLCGCINRCYVYRTDTFLLTILDTNTYIVDVLRSSSTSCIMFSKHELPCVPEHLQYEMYRAQTQTDMND